MVNAMATNAHSQVGVAGRQSDQLEAVISQFSQLWLRVLALFLQEVAVRSNSLRKPSNFALFLLDPLKEDMQLLLECITCKPPCISSQKQALTLMADMYLMEDGQ